MKERIQQNWLFALLTFLILVVASPPFLEVYQLGNSPLLLAMLAVICLVTLLFKNFLVTFPLYLLSYLTLLYSYFPLDQAFSFNWLTAFFDEVMLTYNQIVLGELNYMPQTIALVIILFFLIALAVLIIHYERLWLSYLLIVGYHLLLVAFNQLQLGNTLLLITVLALLFHQLKSYPDSLSFISKSKAFFLSMIIFSLFVGATYSFQLLVPQTRSFLFMQTGSIREAVNRLGLYQHIAQYGQSGLSKSGFSENDQQLGGALLDDASVVFTALQQNAHYWRVETKETYTGKGWESFSPSLHFIGNQETLVLEDPEYLGSLGPETAMLLRFTNAVTYLPQAYGRMQLPLNQIGGAEEIPEKNRINLKEAPKEFQLTWQEPEYDENDLQQISFDSLSNWQALVEQGTMSQQLILPPTVTERTTALAAELTQNETSLYGKVKAIEHYLKTDEGFRYSKTDTIYPENNQDYVDHFLFESKVGYCDNFSTAMIVLLRTQGIPSRWAKGFAPGEVTGQQNDLQEYTIRNSHAHSWPEVYFEGYGWVPFEPTPSFDNPDTPDELALESSVSSEVQESSAIDSSSEAQNSTPSTSTSTSTENKAEPQDSSTIQWGSILRWLLVGISLFIVILAGFFLKNYHLMLRYQLYRRLKPDDFTKAYLLLLKQAEQRYPRADSEPLDRYAQRVEKEYPLFEGSFISLTSLYEGRIYGKQQSDKAVWIASLDQVAKLLVDLGKKKS